MKQKLPLIIALSLPVVLVVMLLIAVGISKASVKPAYDFLFTQEDQYSITTKYQYAYKLEGSRLVKEKKNLSESQLRFNTLKDEGPQLFLYDVENDSTRVVSFEEAERLTLIAGPSSPDGYTVRYDYGHSGIFELFGSNGRDSAYVISKDSAEKPLRAITQRYGELNIIGWIKN